MGTGMPKLGNLLCLAFALIISASTPSIAKIAIVRTGFELQKALADPATVEVYLANNITLTHGFAHKGHHLRLKSIINRNVTIASAASAERQQLQDPSAAEPFWLNCNYLSNRVTLAAGRQLTLRNLVAYNCHTTSPAGFVRKKHNAVLRFEGVVEVSGSVCLPPEVQYDTLLKSPRAPSLAIAAGSWQQQHLDLSLARNGSNWCNATVQLNSSSSSGRLLFQPLIHAAADLAVCQYPAIRIADAALQLPSLLKSGGTKHGELYIFQAVHTSIICPQPVPQSCIASEGPNKCLALAHRRAHPDSATCSVTDGITFRQCLKSSRHSTILLLQSVTMDLTTFPLTQQPPSLARDITIQSDPLGPRFIWDCGSLTDRFHLMPGHSVTLDHIVLVNCSTPTPVSIFTFAHNTSLSINDTFVVPAVGLCPGIDEKLQEMLQTGQHASAAIQRAQPGSWCSNNSGAIPAGGQMGDTMDSGPAYAATLSEPAATAYYVHDTWPAHSLCEQQALLMNQVAAVDSHGWIDDDAAMSSSTPTQQGGSAYTAYVTTGYTYSAWLCPAISCSNTKDCLVTNHQP